MRFSIYADAFIPMKEIENPSPLPISIPPDVKYCDLLHGDDREPEKVGSARLWSIVYLDLTSADPDKGSERNVGESIGYKYEVVGNRIEKVPYRAKAVINHEKSNEDVRKEGDSIIVIIHGACSLPLITVAPDIDYHWVIGLKPVGDKLHYQVEGFHDGFPAYALFIGSTLVYSHDPRTTGQTPLSLMGSGEFNVSRSGDIPLTDLADEPVSVSSGPGPSRARGELQTYLQRRHAAADRGRDSLRADGPRIGGSIRSIVARWRGTGGRGKRGGRWGLGARRSDQCQQLRRQPRFRDVRDAGVAR